MNFKNIHHIRWLQRVFRPSLMKLLNFTLQHWLPTDLKWPFIPSILNKYSMLFCLISEIIHPRQVIFNDAKRSWILSYRGRIISVLNKNRHWIFVFLYTPSTKQNLGWMLTRQSKFQWQHNFLFCQKKFNYNIFKDIVRSFSMFH